METLKSVGILYLQDFLRGVFDKVPTKVWIKKKERSNIKKPQSSKLPAHVSKPSVGEQTVNEF